MRITRVFNNNVVATLTDENTEAVVQGAGVGFQKKPGDLIDKSKIQKIYHILDENRKKFKELFDETPIEYFQIAEMIMERAEKELHIHLNNQIILTLTDHIFFAVERKKEGIETPNLVNEEIRYLYREEYKVAEWAVKFISLRTGVQLGSGEAGYIALHIASAITNISKEHTMNMVLLTQGILRIMRSTYGSCFDTNELSAIRLKTHLKFLAQRVLHKEQVALNDFDDMYQMLARKDAKLENCIEEIAAFILEKFGYELSRAEKVYLMIHLLKVIQ